VNATREDEAQPTSKEWREAMAKAIAEAAVEGALEDMEDPRRHEGHGDSIKEIELQVGAAGNPQVRQQATMGLTRDQLGRKKF